MEKVLMIISIAVILMSCNSNSSTPVVDSTSVTVDTVIVDSTVKEVKVATPIVGIDTTKEVEEKK
jgi:uncharacterized protein YcfL